jgi:hypothetical protein
MQGNGQRLNSLTSGDPAIGKLLAEIAVSDTASGAGPAPNPAGLDGFRVALERLQHRLEKATRPSRFKPVEDLSLAQIAFGDPPQPLAVVGEILDLSRDGMKIALAVSQAVEVDQRCHLLVAPPEAECYELMGTVRWVDRNRYITVFGLALQDASVHLPPA